MAAPHRGRYWETLYVSGKLPTYPSPKPTVTLTSHLEQNIGLGEGYVGSFPETYNDPILASMSNTQTHHILKW